MALQEHRVEVGGMSWFYREAIPLNDQQRPPVVLVHGLVAQSYSWRIVMEALAHEGFRAYAPDLIGQGFSELPEKRDFAYTPDAQLQALSAWIDQLQLGTFSLVVQGFGGTPGLLYALQFPDRIERLVICNTPVDSTASVPWKIKQLGLPLLGEVFTQDPLLVDRTLEGGGPYQVDDEALDVYRRPFLKTSAAGRGLLATVRNMRLKQTMATLEDNWSRWDKPMLIAWGDCDRWLPMTMAETLAQRLPQAELARLEEVGHYVQEDWPEKLNEVMLPFLRRQVVA